MTTADFGQLPDYVAWFVDRSKQYKRYREMLAGETPMAVMLIEAPTAMGKSFLIKKMGYLAGQDSLPYVLVDFRERRAHDTLWLTRHTRDQLSRSVPPEIFNELTVTINQAAGGLAAAGSRRPTTHLLELARDGRSLSVEIDLVAVRQHLGRFDESEIRTLTFDLGLKYGDLVGENLAARIVSLIETCERYQLLDQLVLWGAAELAHLTWWREVEPPTAAAAEPAASPGAVVADHYAELRAASPQARDLALRQINRAFFNCLRAVLDRQRLVFLFDSYEDATDEAEQWIVENLLHPLYDGRYDNLVVVIAGRQILTAEDRKPLVGKTGLDPFTIDHVREYLLEKRQIQEDDIEKIYSYCRGFPGILATMADAYTSALDSDEDW